MTTDYKRNEVVRGSKLRRFHQNVEELERLFADKSYALVRQPYDRKTYFMPLIPRHLNNELWQQLWYHKVLKLVINGKKYKSLCSICPKALACATIDERLLECKARAREFDIDVTRRFRAP